MTAERRKQEVKEQKEMYSTMSNNKEQLGSTLRSAMELMDSLEEKLNREGASLITVHEEDIAELVDAARKIGMKLDKSDDIITLMKMCYLAGKQDAYSVVRRSLKSYVEE